MTAKPLMHDEFAVNKHHREHEHHDPREQQFQALPTAVTTSASTANYSDSSAYQAPPPKPYTEVPVYGGDDFL